MKAKEIVKRIREKLDAGVRENEAYASEVSDDFTRMRDTNKDRKGSDAALLRIVREYNQKWNVVIDQISSWPEFQDQGRSWLTADDFVRHTVSLTAEKHSPEAVEQEIKIFLAPQSISNHALRQAQRRQREERMSEDFERRMIRQFFGIKP